MNMDWTNEQNQAITSRGKSLIVSASAGSGKTAVLVERLLGILSDTDHPVKADEMVVVTFTNDAAAEMKQRLTQAISGKLDDMSRNHQQNEEQYHWLVQQRSLLGNARISTIHSFCFDLIRENAEECGVSSQFRIAESAQDAVYRRRALQNVLEKFSREQPEQSEFLFSCFCTRNDKKLEQILMEIDKFLNSTAFPDHWISKAETFGQKEPDHLLDCIRRGFAGRVEDAIRIAEKSRDIARSIMCTMSGEYPFEEKIIKPEIAMMQQHVQYVRTADKTTLLADPQKYPVEFLNLRSVKAPGCVKDEQNYQIFKEIRDLYKNIYREACGSFLKPLKFYLEDEAILAQVIPLLLDLTRQYRAELFQEKKQQNVLGFDDAEYLVLTKLLGQIDEQGRIRRTALAKALAKQYQFIMVDEYQDSNNRQDRIFQLLADSEESENSENSGDSGNSENQENPKLNYGDHIFLVGDVKQAIYRFRNANPDILKTAIRDSGSDPDMQTIYLNQNFRSSRGVVDFVNAFFSSVMTEQCGEVAYSLSEQLNFGAKLYENLGEAHQKTQILFAQADPENTFENVEDSKKAKNSKKSKKSENSENSEKSKKSGKSRNPKEKPFAVQASCIADTIREMIDNQSPVMTKAGVRPCQFKDFCILMRTKKNHGVLAEEFRKRNIPFVCQEDNHFLELPEIRLIWNLLRIINNPMTDLAMASVLLSPLYGFSTEELAILKLLAPDQKRLYLQIRHLAEQDNPGDAGNPELSEKCRAFLEQLEQLRKLADRMSLEDCIQEIYDITDLLSLQSLYGNSDERRENLEIFAQYARDYREHADLSSQSCLSGWLRYLDHLAESEDQEDFKAKNSPLVNSDFVSVKTIHKSKGLEYPFIFVANLERDFTKKGGSVPVLAEESGLIGLRMLDQKQYLRIKTVAFSYLDLIRAEREKHEEMRLFYVALTRAKQQLFLVMDGSVTKTKYYHLLESDPKLIDTLAKEAKSMQDWLMWFLFSAGQGRILRDVFRECSYYENPENFRDLENPEKPEYSEESPLANYIVRIPGRLVQTAPEQILIPETAPDDAMTKQIREQLGFAYQSALAVLPAKYSVTELSHAEKEIQIREPEFLTQETKIRKLYGKARGTAIHKIMQFMDFRNAEQNLTEELQRIEETGCLTHLEAHALRTGKLRAFFKSDLYRRISLSDHVEKEKQLFVQIADLALPENSEFAKKYADTDGVIIGTVDLLFHEPDGWVIVDYKTDKSQSPEELLQKYSKQLGLYQKAMELILSEPVKQAYIYYFTEDQTLEVNLSQIAY